MLAALTEDQQLVGKRKVHLAGVLGDLPVREVLGHRAVTHPQRLLPDHMPPDEVPPALLVGANHVAREVGERVDTGIPGRHQRGMHGDHPAGDQQPVQFLDEEVVLLEELVVVPRVGQIPVVARVVVEPAEGWAVDRGMDRGVGKRLHHLHRIAAVDRPAVGHVLV